MRLHSVMVRHIAAASGAALLLGLTGCGEGGDATPGDPPRPTFADDGTVAVDDFNAYLEDVDADWKESPEAVARRFAHGTLQEGELIGTSVGPGDDGGSVVVVTVTGLADDSIEARRTSVALAPDGEEWRLVSASWTQRCKPDRGHGDWSTEPCV
jgi:hypothetical protein